MLIRNIGRYFAGILFVSLTQASFAQVSSGEQIPSAWLQAKITVEEAERKNPGLPDDPRAARHPDIVKPFAFLNARWETLKAEIQPGDELWEFSSSGPSWAALAGRAGIALVRNGKVVDSMVTLMN